MEENRLTLRYTVDSRHVWWARRVTAGCDI